MIEKGTRVWVIGFTPDNGGVGGFDWTPTRESAVRLLNEQLFHDPEGQNALTFRAVTLPADFVDRDAVTAWLDTEATHLWEVADR